jgi:hypothetical protein
LVAQLDKYESGEKNHNKINESKYSRCAEVVLWKLEAASATSGPESASGAATASGEASVEVATSSGSNSATGVLLQPLRTFLRPLRGRRLLKAGERVGRRKEGADVDSHSRVGVLGGMHWIGAPHNCESIFDVVVCHLGTGFSGAQLAKVESGA